MTETVKIKLIKDGQPPKKAHETDAAWDLYVRDVKIGKKQLTFYLGFKMEIPPGYVAKIYPRSSVSKIGIRLSNSVGIIDPDYRGEIMAVFDIIDPTKLFYTKGERCCQMRIEKDTPIEIILTNEELSETKRGSGGYGSTGIL